VDHTCHRCRATIEEGVPFCPQCGAPQIRVAGTNVPAEGSTFPPGTPGGIQPPAQPVPLTADTGINWSNGVPAAALAGLLMAIVCVIPVLGVGCCLWILGGGALAVMFYQRRQKPLVVSRGMGMRLGLLSGIFGFFIYAVLEAFRIVVFHLGGVISTAMRQGMERAASQNPDPHAQQVLQWLMSPPGMAAMATVFTAAYFIGFLVFASFGGALGASIWGQRQQGQP
jgi:zinc-ribbon domain